MSQDNKIKADPDFFDKFDVKKKAPQADPDFFDKFDVKPATPQADPDYFDAFFSEGKKEADESFFDEFDKKKAQQQADPDFFDKFGAESIEPQADPDFFEQEKQEKIKRFIQSLGKEQLIEELKKDGKLLSKATEGHRDDIEIVTTAVENTVNAFPFASKRLRQSKEVVKLFVEIYEVKIEEAKLNNNTSRVAFLRKQIDKIKFFHELALTEDAKDRGMGITM